MVAAVFRTCLVWDTLVLLRGVSRSGTYVVDLIVIFMVLKRVILSC